MKGLAITSKGIEDIAALEIRELVNADCKIEEYGIIFDFKDFKELCLLCYKCQSADRIIYLMDNFEFNDFFEELKDFVSNLGFEDWVKKCNKFKVECIRIGTHNFKSVDAEAKSAKLIIHKLDNAKFDVKEHDLIFFIYIVNNKCYFGIDFCGFELNKRSYKIFLHANSLRGTIAYALVRESGFQKKEVMLDPFSRDGVIAIESAFYATDFPCNYYNKEKFAFLKLQLGIDFEKLFKSIDNKARKVKPNIYSYDHLFKYVDYSKKNAKIAGVNKYINFSRTELEWLDVKFKKESVDRIITNPPISKNAPLDKIFDEFFYQCEFILNKNGTLALILKTAELMEKYAEKHRFIILKKKEVWSGEQLLKIIVLKKKNI